MTQWEYWQQHWEDAKAVLEPLGLYRREGTAECVFLRPDDAKMHLIENGHIPNNQDDDLEGYLRGPNVWVIEWKSQGVFSDNRRLWKHMRTLIGPKGTGSWDKTAPKLLNAR